MDANGNQVWAETYSGPMNAGDISDDIAVDNQGNVFVTGKSLGIDTSYDYATIKYDSDGNQLWAVRYNDSVNGDDESGLLSLDSKGNVYVTGSSTNGSRNSDYATVKYDTNGNQLWLVRYSGLDNIYNVLNSFA
ncbi:MAG: SBBP repeat-containing protein [Dehalococcoidales bacterium]